MQAGRGMYKDGMKSLVAVNSSHLIYFMTLAQFLIYILPSGWLGKVDFPAG